MLCVVIVIILVVILVAMLVFGYYKYNSVYGLWRLTKINIENKLIPVEETRGDDDDMLIRPFNDVNVKDNYFHMGMLSGKIQKNGNIIKIVNMKGKVIAEWKKCLFGSCN